MGGTDDTSQHEIQLLLLDCLPATFLDPCIVSTTARRFLLHSDRTDDAPVALRSRVGKRYVYFANIESRAHPLLRFVDTLDANVGAAFLVQAHLNFSAGNGILCASNQIVPSFLSDNLWSRRHEEKGFRLALFQCGLAGRGHFVSLLGTFRTGVVLAHT